MKVDSYICNCCPENLTETHLLYANLFLKDLPGIRGSAIKEIDNPGSSSDGVGLTELEIILKQKTFTRQVILESYFSGFKLILFMHLTYCNL